MKRSWVVLITGCSSGIGYALAEAFHAAGCQTHASARKLETLHALAARGIHTHALDVTRPASIQAVVEHIEREHGAIDLLVNNAGIPVMGPTAEVPLEQLEQLWQTNVTGPVAMVQAVVPGMARRGAGRIVNIGSVSGLLTTPFAGPYCASKAALHSLNDALRMELKPFGIEVILVQPGGVQSGFGAGATKQTGLHAWKLFAPMAAAIEQRAQASQHNAMQASDFATAMVQAVLSRRPPATLRIGTGSLVLPNVARLPSVLRDRLLMRRFGLSDALVRSLR
jgi:NAD(P)-dependent dehydrogenase (short-subunit alcohol dehydrogenase family)